MRSLISLLLIHWTSTAMADGGIDEPPTNPVVHCTGGQVFDPGTRECVDPRTSGLDRDVIYEAVRHLAYSGRYAEAQLVTRALAPDDPGRLTYLGFTHRKLGDFDRGMQFYKLAIKADPANILARSYMGQAFVEKGDFLAAMEQLDLLRWHGGQGTWSERSLRVAIATGETFNY